MKLNMKLNQVNFSFYDSCNISGFYNISEYHTANTFLKEANLENFIELRGVLFNKLKD